MLIRLSDSARLYHADCRDAIRSLPDNSIDSVVTDPPYALVSIVKRFGSPNAAPAKGNDAYMRASAGFMGRTWDTGEVAFSEEFWAEVLRVLKPGGHVAAFGASRGYHRMACAIEDAGFEIRDSLMWCYATGFPKSQNVSLAIDKKAGAVGHLAKSFNMKGGGDRSEEFADNGRDFSIRHEPVTDDAKRWSGFGTALKPAFEPIVLARKPLSEGTVAANVLRWGTGALNIDGCRVGEPIKHQPGGLHRGSGSTVGSFTGATEFERADHGRWPANICHDGSDEVVGAFPNTAPSKAAKDNKPMQRQDNNVYGKGLGSISPNNTYNDNGGSAARFFYSAKASKADRAGSKHPTVKPVSLMEWLATLITPPGGTILDPFAGSGTTGAAAARKGFSVILIEREDEYVEDIKRRFGAGATPVKAAAVAPVPSLPASLTRLLQWNTAARAKKVA